MILMQGSNRVFDSAIVEDNNTTSTSRVLTIYGVTSYSELTNVLLPVKAIAFGEPNSITININSLGNKSIKSVNSSGSKINPAQAWAYTGCIYLIYYDGTDFVLLNTLGSGGGGGSITVEDDLTSDSHDNPPSVHAVNEAIGQINTILQNILNS